MRKSTDYSPLVDNNETIEINSINNDSSSKNYYSK